MEIKGSWKTKIAQCVGSWAGTENPHLDVEKSLLIVTDGHVIVALPVKCGEGETSGPVPVAAIKPLLKKFRLGEKRPVVFCGDTVSVSFPDGVGMSFPRKQKREFPAWEKVMDKKQCPLTFAVNAQLLANVQAAFACDYIEIYASEAESGITICPMGRPSEGMAVVMPARTHNSTFPTIAAVK